ncbi:MAG: hydantoinase/oxoprolinase family protein [Actinobacteria bacterium]|nr:hydantoinase/oxoprolinase family protein [Actinomycetota bacterium]
MSLRVGVDTGGTFTDLVGRDTRTGATYSAKVPSTPADPLQAVLGAFERAAVPLGEVELLVLGTTVGTNALIERRGARVAYLTTEGFEDIPFIQRGNRPHQYAFDWVKPKPFLERWQCLGVAERTLYDGTALRPLDGDAVARAVAALGALIEAEGIEAAAVSLLHSYVDPSHELALEAGLREAFPGLPVSLSHRVAPVWREYERGLSTIADAYLKPLLSSFATALEEGLAAVGFGGRSALLRSNGGTRLAPEAAEAPLDLLLSGLAGGVIGGRHYGLPESGELITLDMGGTSCDVAIVEGGDYRLAPSYEVEFGLPLIFPTIELTTIGAGGGSIAWLDRGGFLRVGPRSAGAEPGPACYGHGGTEPTVTDANLVLGRLNPEYFLGGAMRLDVDAAERAIGRLAAELGCSPRAAALAVIEIADENMVAAIGERTVEIGIDPRRFTLVAFGGAGGLHGAALARRLGIGRVLVPPHPGLCSAFGALSADLRSDRISTVRMRSDAIDVARLDARVGELVEEARAELAAEGFAGEPRLRTRLAMRYLGQNYEHEVELPEQPVTAAAVAAAAERFEALHEQFYGYQLGGEAVELVQVSVTAVGSSEPPTGGRIDGSAGPPSRRPVVFAGEVTGEVEVHRRAALAAGTRLAGPLIVEEPDGTTLVGPGDGLLVRADGSLVIEIGQIEGG